MFKEIIIGLFIGLVMLGFWFGASFIYYQREIERKRIEWELMEETIQTINKFTSKELLEITEEERRLHCEEVVTLSGDKTVCKVFFGVLVLDHQDICYFCFATKKRDASLCKEISEDSPLREYCKEHF